ncbi:MAG: GNAT family N-acetyltransferase [Deltaproteobacteria bacterium]|nr:GNAT family N-acetyltransferase [Deltaproteobacteria bacterium]
MSTIRPALLADLPLLAARLSPLPLFTRYGHTATRLEQLLGGALGRGEQLLVIDADGPRGMAWFLTSGTLGIGGYLRLIAVDPTFQNRGTGAALLAAFETHTFAKSAHAFLLVSDFNDGAQRFYERHGYVRVGALAGLVLPEVNELLYWKRRPPAS